MAVSTDDLIALKARGLSYQQIANNTGLTYNAVRGRVRRAGGNVIVDDVSELELLRRENAQLKALLQEREEDDLFGEPMGEPFTIDGDCMIAGDIHCHTIKRGFIERPLQIAREYLTAPRRFIVAGDLLNADAFSGYEPTHPTPSFSKEIKAARAFFDLYLSVFDEIYVFPGNHDLRPVKRNHAAIDFDMVMKIISHEPRIKVSPIGHMIINTPEGQYRATHGSDYSVNQLVVAEQLAHKFQQHIISWHEHHTAVGLDRFKNWRLVNGGGLFDMASMPYTQVEDNKKPRMANGFVMLRNGYPYLFAEKLTDWSFWIKAQTKVVAA